MWFNLSDDDQKLITDTADRLSPPNSDAEALLLVKLQALHARIVDQKAENDWPETKAFVKAAGFKAGDDVDIEGDGCISSSDNGAYVLAWQWVSNEEAGILPPIVALLSAQGTACPETALVGDEDTPEERAKVEAEIVPGPDAPVAGTWTDVSDNEAVRAAVSSGVTE